MRTRRSARNQDKLYRAIGRDLARAVTSPPEGFEADQGRYACPDGPYCKDPKCILENDRRAHKGD